MTRTEKNQARFERITASKGRPKQARVHGNEVRELSKDASRRGVVANKALVHRLARVVSTAPQTDVTPTYRTKRVGAEYMADTQCFTSKGRPVAEAEVKRTNPETYDGARDNWKHTRTKLAPNEFRTTYTKRSYGGASDDLSAAGPQDWQNIINADWAQASVERKFKK